MLSCVILELPCSCNFCDRGGREGGMVDYRKQNTPDNIIFSRRVLAYDVG